MHYYKPSLNRDAVVILAACCNEDVSDDVYLLLGSIHTHGNDAPQSFLNVFYCDQKLTIGVR